MEMIIHSKPNETVTDRKRSRQGTEDEVAEGHELSTTLSGRITKKIKVTGELMTESMEVAKGLPASGSSVEDGAVYITQVPLEKEQTKVSKGPVSISTVPPELQEEIFSYLDIDDLLTMCSFSTVFDAALSAKYLWEKACEHESVPAQPKGLNMSAKDWATVMFTKVYSPNGMPLPKTYKGWWSSATGLIERKLLSLGVMPTYSQWWKDYKRWIDNRAHQAIMDAYKKAKPFIDLYDKFRATLPRHESAFLPAVANIMMLLEFKDFVHSSKNVRAPDYATDPHAFISGLIEKWNAQRREEILKYSLLKGDDGPKPNETLAEEDLEQLSLAFRCVECKVILFGWEDIKNHGCGSLEYHSERHQMGFMPHLDITPSSQPAIIFVPGVKDLLRKVDQWANLVARDGVMVKDMDTNAEECVFLYSKRDRRPVKFTLNWRRYADYVTNYGSEELREVRNSPRGLTVNERTKVNEFWKCGCCEVVYNRNYNECLRHVVKRHRIADPKTPEDVYFYDRSSMLNMFPWGYGYTYDNSEEDCSPYDLIMDRTSGNYEDDWEYVQMTTRWMSGTTSTQSDTTDNIDSEDESVDGSDSGGEDLP